MEMQQGIRMAVASGFRRIAARLPDRIAVLIAAAPGLERRPDCGDIRDSGGSRIPAAPGYRRHPD
jgi:hypothetical protein